MNTKIGYIEPPPRRAYAMILMLIGSTVISFSGDFFEVEQIEKSEKM